MSSRRTSSVVVAAVAWTLAAASLALVPFTEPTWHVGQWYFLVDFADALVFGGVAAILLARGRHPVAWIVAACGIGGGLAALGFQWSMVLTVHPDLPRLDPLSAMQNTAWVPGTLGVILVLPWLVRSTPLRAVDRAMIAAGALLIAAIVAGRLTDPFPWPDGPTMAPFPVRSEWWSGLLENVFPWEIGAVCLLAYVAAADLIRRKRLDPARRRGLGWLAVACVLMTTAFVPLALPASWVEGLPVWFTPVLHLSSQLFFPAALLVAVLGQRLEGLDVAVDRATVYALVTGGAVGVYLAVVWGLGSVLPDGQVPGLLGVAVVVALLQPARRSVQRRVSLLIRGDVDQPLEALARVGQGIGTASGAQLAEAVAESVRDALRLGGAAIEVDWPSGARRLAQVGDLGTDHQSLPLVVEQEHVGELLVAARRGERLDPPTLDAAGGLAPIVAATVQLVARTRALSESRARISQARDEERRQLRRELHDGFGPALAGVGLGMEAARNLVATDPQAAGDLLAQLAAEVEERVEDVRTLARGLLPPILEDQGLEPALHELAERHRLTEGLDVQIDTEAAVGPLGVEVRSALYGIVAEAVRNVVRHAGARHCRVTLRREGGVVVVQVEDDGVGVDPAAVPGVGLRSMRERAEAVGGTLRVERTDTGTVVDARVPSVSAPSAGELAGEVPS